MEASRGGYPSGQRGLTVNQLRNASEVRILPRPCQPCILDHGQSSSAPYALVAQWVEHILGKNGVTGSSPVEGFLVRWEDVELLREGFTSSSDT